MPTRLAIIDISYLGTPLPELEAAIATAAGGTGDLILYSTTAGPPASVFLQYAYQTVAAANNRVGQVRSATVQGRAVTATVVSVTVIY